MDDAEGQTVALAQRDKMGMGGHGRDHPVARFDGQDLVAFARVAVDEGVGADDIAHAQFFHVRACRALGEDGAGVERIESGEQGDGGVGQSHAGVEDRHGKIADRAGEEGTVGEGGFGCQDRFITVHFGAHGR